MSKDNLYICPACETVYTDQTVLEYSKRKAMKILVEHGFPLRTVGKLMNAHPQTVKYHAAVPKS